MSSKLVLITVSLALAVGTGRARGEVVAVDVRDRQPFAAGQSFGDTGPYEQITGSARFAVDPNHTRNKVIVDLALAPRNADGKVEFESDFCILAPKDPAKDSAMERMTIANAERDLAGWDRSDYA